MNHQVALLAVLALTMKFQGMTVELLTPAPEMEFEVIQSIRAHEGPEVEEREVEEEEMDVLKPRKEEEE